MRLRPIISVLILTALTATARGEQSAPRDIWPQAASEARDADVSGATKKTNELIDTGRAYGLKRFPDYAVAAAAFARQSAAENKTELADWGDKTATLLDPKSPAVLFSQADAAADKRIWSKAAPAATRGFMQIFSNYHSSTLSRADLVIVFAISIALTAIIFSITLFIRYGRAMAHDFREMLGRRVHGGSVTVLAFALLFLPIFIWLGPMWLIFYWMAIFFGYGTGGERTLIILLGLLVAVLPLGVDLAGTWTGGIDSPVVISAISSAEQSYQPEALRRMQELVTIFPDNSTLQVLLGNMFMFDGNEQQSADHYRRAIQLNDYAGAHVNLGNLHFLQNDYAAASTEYSAAQKRDPNMAIAFYNDSVASGEMYHFDEQGQKLGHAKTIDKEGAIERFAQSPPPQKIAMYHPKLSEAWDVAMSVARKGVGRSLFGNYAYFDATTSAMNPVTIGALLSVILALMIWSGRRSKGFAGSCIKCGRTFCHRCKSARESATYCTQCIHIYLKRDGVALATKRSKLEEVSDHQIGMQRRNRLFATFLPGSAQMLEGRTNAGIVGMLLFFIFLATAVFVGRLAPALGPVAVTAQTMVRILAIVLAVSTWFAMSVPVYRRRPTV